MSVTAISRQPTPKSPRNSRQLQPYVAFGVGSQLRRKRSKNDALNDEARCQTEWPSDQKPNGAVFDIAIGDRSEQRAFGSDEENPPVVRWKTEWHFASRTSPNGSRVVAMCKAELTHGACQRPPEALHLLSQFDPPRSSQNSTSLRAKHIAE